MSDKKESKHEENGYLFTLEVLVKGKTNGLALEKLTRLLNASEDVTDYRIVKGINLGQIIDAAIKLSEQKKEQSKKEALPTKAATPKGKSTGKSLLDQIKQIIEEKKLVRLSIVKGKGVKLSIPCRILNLDEASQHITAYHVDEKAVYSFHLTEIDELTLS